MIYLTEVSLQISRKMDGYYIRKNGIHLLLLLKGLKLSSVFNFVGSNVSNLDSQSALAHAQLDWTVTTRPIWVNTTNGEQTTTNKFFATTRDDNNTILGVVGPDYRVVQNEELMYLASRVSNSDVKIVGAGPLDGGRRVFVQMQGNAFGVGPNRDENIPMTLFTNGHDGQWPLSSLPTSKRVICENTLNMAISTGRKNDMIISMRHTGDIQMRLESMIQAIENWQHRTAEFKKRADHLAFTDVSTQFVQKFWTEVYMAMFGNIHGNPSTEEESADNKAAQSTMTKWSNTFDSEVKLSGANLWTAMNAVTHWIDHGQIYRGEKKNENRFNDTLFGNGAKEKINIMNRALAIA